MDHIETERLRLRPFTTEDAEFVLKLVNDEAWVRNIGDRGIRNLEEARGYIGKMTAMYDNYGHGAYRVALKDSGLPVGMAGLLRRDGLDDADIGFALLPAYYGQGYAYEASVAVLREGREKLGLARITAITVPTNQSSINLLEKLGMVFEKILRLPGGTEDLCLYAIEWPPEPVV